MADVDGIFQEVVDGLIDNSRVNNVSYTEGWDADTALDTYFLDPDMGFNADLQERLGMPNEAETAAILSRVTAWLKEHEGQRHLAA